MENLAITYGSLGRHQDALALQEKALEMFESAENHPRIGVMSLWVFMPRVIDLFCSRHCHDESWHFLQLA
jgi:hypothetical protein